MADTNEMKLDVIQEAMIESFEDGRLVTTTDGARPGKIRIIGNIDLPEPVVKWLLGDLYDGAVSSNPNKAARGSGFQVKDSGAIGSEDTDFDNP